jgi:hypothetical protein
VTVDHGLVGIKVDVCSATSVADWICVDEAEEVARVSSCEVCIADNCVDCVEALPCSEVEEVSDDESTCHAGHDQIQPVFVGSTEQTMSDEHVRMLFHWSSKHPIKACQQGSLTHKDDNVRCSSKP